MAFNYLKIFNLIAMAIFIGVTGPGIAILINMINGTDLYGTYASYVIVILMFLAFNTNEWDFSMKKRQNRRKTTHRRIRR